MWYYIYNDHVLERAMEKDGVGNSLLVNGLEIMSGI